MKAIDSTGEAHTMRAESVDFPSSRGKPYRFRVMRDCCNIGNCIACKHLPFGTKVHVEQFRAVTRERAEEVAANWRSLHGYVVPIDGSDPDPLERYAVQRITYSLVEWHVTDTQAGKGSARFQVATFYGDEGEARAKRFVRDLYERGE